MVREGVTMFLWFKNIRIAFLEKELFKLDQEARDALVERQIDLYRVVCTERAIVESKLKSLKFNNLSR